MKKGPIIRWTMVSAFAAGVVLSIAHSGAAVAQTAPYSHSTPPGSPTIAPSPSHPGPGQTPGPTQSPTVLPTIIHNTPSPGNNVGGIQQHRRPPSAPGSNKVMHERPGGLPFTGVQLTLYVAIALAIIAAGVTLVRASRRRPGLERETR